VTNTWLGFWAVLVDPSPKFHCHEVGGPEEVSVNCTACPAVGEAGLNVKDAESVDEGSTVSVWLAVFVPELVLAFKVTV
jgi:hypothetical protein